MMGGDGMGGNGLNVMLILAALIVIPFWRLLSKFGSPNWVGLFASIPLGAPVLLWVTAFGEKLDGGHA